MAKNAFLLLPSLLFLFPTLIALPQRAKGSADWPVFVYTYTVLSLFFGFFLFPLIKCHTVVSSISWDGMESVPSVSIVHPFLPIAMRDGSILSAGINYGGAAQQWRNYLRTRRLK